MGFNHVTGAMKGAITKHLKKEGLVDSKGFDLDFDGLFRMLDEPEIRQGTTVGRKFLIEDLGFAKDSETVRGFTMNEDGDFGYSTTEEEHKAKVSFQIERYGVPKGSKVSTDAIKAWIDSKGLMENIRDPQLKKTRQIGKDKNKNIWDEDEKLKDRLAFLIIRKMKNEGYETVGKEYGSKEDGDFEVVFMGQKITLASRGESNRNFKE